MDQATLIKKGRGTNLVYRDYCHKKDRRHGAKQHWRYNLFLVSSFIFKGKNYKTIKTIRTMV